MKQFVAVASLLGLAAAEPFYGYGGYASSLTHGYAPAIRTAYAAAPIARVVPAPVAAAVVPTPAVVAAAPATTYVSQPAVATVEAVPAKVHAQQYHAQDEFGNYEYGYDNPNSQKKEGGNARGVVQGHYLVKDAYQTRRYDYVADAAGFRAHRTIKREADAEAYYGNYYGAGGYGSVYGASAFAPATYGYAQASYGYAPAAPVARVVPAPVTVAAAPVAVAAAPAPATTYVSEPATVASTLATVKAVPANVHAQQYHAQDEFGNFEYGYDNPNSQKKEGGNARGVVQGHYTVKDRYGLDRRVDYVADAAGFRATKNFY